MKRRQLHRRPVQKVVRKVSLREQPTDFAYWQERSYEERLAALEEIRREYHQWNQDTQPRLQKLTGFSDGRWLRRVE